MNYIWTSRFEELFDNGETRLYTTNCRKLKIGEEVYINANGYVQRKKTKNYIGFVVKTGKNLTMLEHLMLTYKLKKKIIKEKWI